MLPHLNLEETEQQFVLDHFDTFKQDLVNYAVDENDADKQKLIENIQFEIQKSFERIYILYNSQTKIRH